MLYLSRVEAFCSAEAIVLCSGSLVGRLYFFYYFLIYELCSSSLMGKLLIDCTLINKTKYNIFLKLKAGSEQGSR